MNPPATSLRSAAAGYHDRSPHDGRGQGDRKVGNVVPGVARSVIQRFAPVPPLRNLVGLALGLFLLAWPFATGAQVAGKVPRIGYVGTPGDPTEARWQHGFLRGLRELGYVPGNSIVIDVRTYTRPDQLRNILDEFVRQRVDVIFVGQPFLAAAATKATREIPIVCGSCGDPIDNGLATSAVPT